MNIRLWAKGVRDRIGLIYHLPETVDKLRDEADTQADNLRDEFRDAVKDLDTQMEDIGHDLDRCVQEEDLTKAIDQSIDESDLANEVEKQEARIKDLEDEVEALRADIRKQFEWQEKLSKAMDQAYGHSGWRAV